MITAVLVNLMVILFSSGVAAIAYGVKSDSKMTKLNDEKAKVDKERNSQ